MINPEKKFRQLLKFLTQVLFTLSLFSLSTHLFASDVITDDQVQRVAKLAKQTKTDITLVKERVTVTFHGNVAGKNTQKIKSSIEHIMKQRSYTPKHPRFSQQAPDFRRSSHVFNDEAPAKMSNVSYRQHPPALDNESYY
jgi:hypothetical protein